jgi:hypothetical protein
VLPDDTPDTLAARVLRAEHALFPRVVEAVAAGRVKLGGDGRACLSAPAPGLRFALVDDGGDAADVDRLFIP